jgi:hypothetical protein
LTFRTKASPADPPRRSGSPGQGSVTKIHYFSRVC